MVSSSDIDCEFLGCNEWGPWTGFIGGVDGDGCRYAFRAVPIFIFQTQNHTRLCSSILNTENPDT